MIVDKIMTHDVKSCRLEDTLSTAAQIMWDNDCGAVPVVDGERVVGMITDRDICMAAWTQDTPLSRLLVSSTFSKDPVMCAPGDSVAKAEEAMRTYQLRRLPVVEKDRLVGILSLNDVARAATEGKRTGAGDVVTRTEVAETLAAVCQPGQESLRI